MKNGGQLKVKFWGVRGSTPTPQASHLGYGGNTSCVELRGPEDQVVILDGGTGIRELGLDLVEKDQGNPIAARVLLTHFHWDHIQGIPFFPALYDSENEVEFYASGRSGGPRQMLTNQMQAPYFPVELHRAPAQKQFFEFSQESLQIGGFTILPFDLNHPQGATGFRAECAGKSVVYATDLEHGNRELDLLLREYSQNADLLIYDAQYTPEEYECHRGWGHSNWLEATQVAKDSNVKRLVLFHHRPGRADTAFAGILDSARCRFESTDAAKERTEILL